jgi:hypothetical protein
MSMRGMPHAENGDKMERSTRKFRSCLVLNYGPLTCMMPATGRVGINKTLQVTPAMAAAIGDALWTAGHIADRIEGRRPQPGKRGP